MLTLVKRSLLYPEGMDALDFRVGSAKLVSYSPARDLPWRVVFEDEGAAGYCYACDGDRATVEDDFDVTVMDAMLVYNTDAMRSQENGDRERLVTIEWSADGLRAALRLDGVPQVLLDFELRESYCRSNFPNFMDDGRNGWRSNDHRWNEDAMLRFEKAALQAR
ncbi:DUF2251 domain-containing protein [Terriglobus aquaticus]|uniref:DUF2251 domain-containing protein n=2 Tax=Terriglobus aquaticus TaxID=940139 RepID=A0ABW9KIR5_9BACT